MKDVPSGLVDIYAEWKRERGEREKKRGGEGKRNITVCGMVAQRRQEGRSNTGQGKESNLLGLPWYKET